MTLVVKGVVLELDQGQAKKQTQGGQKKGPENGAFLRMQMRIRFFARWPIEGPFDLGSRRNERDHLRQEI